MKTDKLVVRLKNKTLLKGRTGDFSPINKLFHMRLLNGEEVMVDMEKIKAAFFVKCYDGNKNYKYKYEDKILWGGNKIEVKFIDGETMIGYAQHYDFTQYGFFITPADLKGNNNRVFVLNSAAEKITFL